MSTEAAADLVAECERLARDCGRLYLADVFGPIITKRAASLTSHPDGRPDEKWPVGRDCPEASVKGGGGGVELADVSPRTAEEMKAAPIWYATKTGVPIVNSVGQSLVIEPGWRATHRYKLGGSNARKAAEWLEGASRWASMRWRWLGPLLWPDRESAPGLCCWPDVVDRVSELANDATLPRPEWSVILGDGYEWWPVSMWKTRTDWQLDNGCGGYTADDVMRIGEIPEATYCKREHWLRDSETALEWLARQAGEQTDTPNTLDAEIVARLALNAVVDGGLAGVLQAAAGTSSADRASEIMRMMLANDRRYYEWKADEWANHLRVTKRTITNGKAWREIMTLRASKKAERVPKPVPKKTRK
jgi:hypothetical protein